MDKIEDISLEQLQAIFKRNGATDANIEKVGKLVAAVALTLLLSKAKEGEGKLVAKIMLDLYSLAEAIEVSKPIIMAVSAGNNTRN